VGSFGAGLAWTVLIDPPLDGAVNMSRDHALALTLPPGRAVLRLYGWARPTLSFGRNEPAVGRWDRNALHARGVDVVRRPTGGRAVLHHREVTYAVVAPLPGRGGLRAAYRRVNEALVRGLAELGVEARLAEGVTAGGLDAGPCFDAPAPGEVVAGGRKLVGSAQARLEGRLLQHGSILLEDDQEWAREFRVVAGAPAGACATLAGLLGSAPAPARVIEALVAGFRRAIPGDWPDGAREDTLPSDMRRRQDRLRTRYASELWTWRR
jgi:lipoate-protein ligase A